MTHLRLEPQARLTEAGKSQANRTRDALTSRKAAAGLAISPAEQRVLKELGSGASNREIAAALYLSVRTVESHISSLLAKTGCRSRTQLVLWVPRRP